jgi:hypothetical protein
MRVMLMESTLQTEKHCTGLPVLLTAEWDSNEAARYNMSLLKQKAILQYGSSTAFGIM